MSPYKSDFTKYQDYNGGKVIMGNNAVCKIIRIGYINLKLHDDTIRELKQVRYVLDLKRNMISLGMLDQIGCSVKIESGVFSNAVIDRTRLWYLRLGYIGEKGLKKLKNKVYLEVIRLET